MQFQSAAPAAHRSFVASHQLGNARVAEALALQSAQARQFQTFEALGGETRLLPQQILDLR
jgi:hypothetical protein